MTKAGRCSGSAAIRFPMKCPAAADAPRLSWKASSVCPSKPSTAWDGTKNGILMSMVFPPALRVTVTASGQRVGDDAYAANGPFATLPR